MAGDNHEGIKGFRVSFNISCISGKNVYCYILKKLNEIKTSGRELGSVAKGSGSAQIGWV